MLTTPLIFRKVFFYCRECKFPFYIGPRSVGAAVIPKIGDSYKVLLVKRAEEYQKGKLECPGGLLRYGEDPWIGTEREVAEEVNGLHITKCSLLHVASSEARFSRGKLSVVVTFFLAHPVVGGANSLRIVFCPEVSELAFYDIRTLAYESLAFNADMEALSIYGSHLQKE